MIPQPHEPIGKDRSTEPWYRFHKRVWDTLTGVHAPQIPVVHVAPGSSQRGLPDADRNGLLVLAVEPGSAQLAYSYNGQWFRAADDTVIS